MRLSGGVEPSHLTVVGLEETVDNQLPHNSCGATRGVHEFLACQFLNLAWILEVDIPVGELQKGEKHFLLFGHSSQKDDADVQG